jgi:2-oxoglutarate/2-oxoacid ferredoxin oxidoreductase subunit alpha
VPSPPRSSLRAEGFDVSSTNLRYLNPLPPDLGDLLKGFDKVLVPSSTPASCPCIIRARFLVDAISMTKIMGRPFKVSELRERILQLLND